MKRLTILMLFQVLFTGSYSGERNAIEFHPRRLDREILSHFRKPGFLLKEIRPDGSPESSSAGQGRFYRLSSGDTLIGYAYVGRVNSCRKGGCNIGSDRPADASAEFFDYFTLFNREHEIISVVVYNYEATHGQEITAKGWLKQFTGYNGNNDLTVGRNVDAISGATISVHGIVDDLVEKTNILKDHTKGDNGRVRQKTGKSSTFVP